LLFESYINSVPRRALVRVRVRVGKERKGVKKSKRMRKKERNSEKHKKRIESKNEKTVHSSDLRENVDLIRD
jgi:hypothetical protein